MVDKAKAIAKASAVKKREKLRNEGKHYDAGLVKPELRTVDPLDYWLKQEKLSDWLSILPGLAQDIMCVPASSVPSERTFSITGVLSSGKFSTIKPETLEMRMLVKCNPHLN